MNKKTLEPGYWNGLPAQITCCIVEVIPSTDRPMMWYNAFAGRTRQVVEITQDGESFIIDNAHGDGYFKATAGQGSPRCGSKHFGEFKLIEYVDPANWQRVYDDVMLAAEAVIIERYQQKTNPEEFARIEALVKGMRAFTSLTPDEQVAHIRENMMPGTPQQPRKQNNFPPGGTGFPQRLFNHKKPKR